MPIYEYQCRACGEGHESFARMSDPVEVTCPACGRDTLVRLISACAAVTDREYFRGQGTLAQQFAGEEHVLEQLAAIAERHGRRPQYTDVYEPSLCRPEIGPGDPEAFVPASGGRSHVREVITARNWDCEGMVRVKTGPLPTEASAAGRPMKKAERLEQRRKGETHG